jgi:hypothetical protein
MANDLFLLNSFSVTPLPKLDTRSAGQGLT